jgi:membrane fusion protein, heavy metal efflux system
MIRLLPRLRAALIAMLLTAGSAAAHEGHDHTDQTKTAPPMGSSPRVEAISGPFELVALLQKGELVIYLDRFETNVPIVGALVTVETPGGPVTASAQEGTYSLAAPWAQTGSHALIFTVTADGLTEILSGTLSVAPGSPETGNRGGWSFFPPAVTQGLKTILGSGGTALVALIAFAAGLIAAMFLRPGRKAFLALAVSGMLLLGSGHAHGHDAGQATTQPTSEIAQRLSDGTLFVPKPTQRILAIRTALTQAATHRKTLELPGRIIPDPNASGFVQASVSGRLSPPTGGFPKLGTIVNAGDVPGAGHASFPGDRRFGHAPEGRRTRSADQHRREADRPL